MPLFFSSLIWMNSSFPRRCASSLFCFQLACCPIGFSSRWRMISRILFLARRFCLFQRNFYRRIPRLASCFWCRSLFLDHFLSSWKLLSQFGTVLALLLYIKVSCSLLFFPGMIYFPPISLGSPHILSKIWKRSSLVGIFSLHFFKKGLKAQIMQYCNETLKRSIGDFFIIRRSRSGLFLVLVKNTLFSGIGS